MLVQKQLNSKNNWALSVSMEKQDQFQLVVYGSVGFRSAQFLFLFSYQSEPLTGAHWGPTASVTSPLDTRMLHTTAVWRRPANVLHSVK